MIPLEVNDNLVETHQAKDGDIEIADNLVEARGSELSLGLSGLSEGKLGGMDPEEDSRDQGTN